MYNSKAFLTVLVVLVGTMDYSYGDLTSASAHEGACFGPIAPANIIDYGFDMAFVLGQVQHWNVPMASEFYYRRYAESFLGRPAADEAELESMNLQASCATLACTQSGYGKNVIQTCGPVLIPTQLNHYQCSATLGTASNLQAATMQTTLIYTDRINTAILGVCFNGTERAFAVYSVSQELTADQNTTVVGELVNAGYNPDFFQWIS